MSGDCKKIRVGSRKSELALIQTRHVIALLQELNPEKEFEIVTMSTMGDKILDIPLPKIGEKSLFTKELETALATGYVDFVVHSLKDLPTVLPDGMAIAAVLKREDPRDALVLQKDLKPCTLKTLPKGSIVGTSSLRRTAQLAKKHPHLKVENIRGNLNTRLKKLDDLGHFQAIILAAAGLVRMGWKDRISKLLDAEEIMYAVGQGALGIECRENDEETIKLLEPIFDIPTALRVTSERSFLTTLGGGCSAPVAVCSNLSTLKNNEISLKLEGAVWSLDGKEEIKDQDEIKVTIRNGFRCASCPLNNNELNSTLGDIECFKECSNCPNSPIKEPPSKKLKVDIPSEILKNDPHEHCPIKLPVGADFMGKCPYLEGDLVTAQNQCPNIDALEGATKCPFLKDQSNNSQTDSKLVQMPSSSTVKKVEESNLFVGLVPHKKAGLECLEKARLLGKRLAENLIAKGAVEVMTKAQSIIHSQTIVSVTGN